MLREIYFRPQKGSWGYSRLATAQAMGITVVAAAAAMAKNADGTCAGLSLAVGGCFERPVLVGGAGRDGKW